MAVGKAREELFVHTLAARTRFKEKTVDNSNDLLVLQERIELSTSPLPREMMEGMRTLIMLGRVLN
jgi:hypothetical protein